MQIFVKRDLDGFFALFVDNLVQLLLIIALCGGLCGMPNELLFGVVLPGCAISILVGNLFYAWQAHRLAKRTGRDDVTALPYGINTPSVIVFVFFVIKPAYDQTGDPYAAWKLGILACLGSGLIEFFGSFVAGLIRKYTPRAALLSTLAGIAIGFISMTFALQIFQKPLIALIPFALILVTLFGKTRLPGSIPGGFAAIALGTIVAWLLTGLQYASATMAPGLSIPSWLTFGYPLPAQVQESLSTIGVKIPQWCGEEIMATIQGMENWLPFINVVVPMGLFNVIGSLQNIESAEAAGDEYGTTSSMVMNGLGTIAAACFGSCFPTTIYIGHPGWKSMGARAGYSVLNGIAIVAICLLGVVGLIASVIPIEVGAGIVLWIGIIITAQAFQSTPQDHAPAVAVGLFPAIAAWGATVMMGTVLATNGATLQDLVSVPTPQEIAADAEAKTEEMADMPENTDASQEDAVSETTTPAETKTIVSAYPDRSSKDVNGFLVHAMLLMERGYIFTCMILAATVACLIDRKFNAAAMWIFSAALFTWLGLMHAYQVYFGMAFDYLFRFMAPMPDSYSYRANDIALAYVLCGLLFLLLGKLGTESESGH